MTTDHNRREEARHKLKGAIYAVRFALEATKPKKVLRTVGKKFHPRRATCISDRDVMRQLSRRKFRAAVLAVVAILELQERRAEQYIHAYKEPVFEWEDTAVPALPRPQKLTREISLELDDLFVSEEDYQRTVSKLKEGLIRAKTTEEKLLYQWQLQAIALAVTTTKLDRAIGLNMHPRNKYKGLEYAVALMPAVNIILQSQEEYSKKLLKLKLRRKLKATVWAVIATHRLEKAAMEKAKKAAKATAGEWKFRHRHSIVEKRVKGKLAWLGSHTPPHHPHHLRVTTDPDHLRGTTEEEDLARHIGLIKMNWAVDEIVKASE